MTARKTAAPRKTTAARKAAAKKAATGKKATKSAGKSARKSAPKKSSRATSPRKASAEKAFAKGDKVIWTTPQGETEGVVERKVTRPMKIKKHEVSASADNPEYIVRSEKSGKTAAHKPGSLRKQGS